MIETNYYSEFDNAEDNYREGYEGRHDFLLLSRELLFALGFSKELIRQQFKYFVSMLKCNKENVYMLYTFLKVYRGDKYDYEDKKQIYFDSIEEFNEYCDKMLNSSIIDELYNNCLKVIDSL